MTRDETVQHAVHSSRDRKTRVLLWVFGIGLLISLLFTAGAIWVGWDAKQNQVNAGSSVIARIQAECAQGQVEDDICDLADDAEQEIQEGPQGPPGATGEPGPPGPPGEDGKDGTDGRNGRSGPPGEDGADGAAGLDGANGADGQDGAPGEPGPPGPAGKDGADGVDGQDGRSIRTVECSNGTPDETFTFTYSDGSTETVRCSSPAPPQSPPA